MSSTDAPNLFPSAVTKSSLKAAAPTSEAALEQYKLYVEMADRISARRQTANEFFLSVNTAIVALLGYLRTVQENSGVGQLYWLVAAAGIALAYMWYRLIGAYKNPNLAKFCVVYRSEEAPPFVPYVEKGAEAGG